MATSAVPSTLLTAPLCPLKLVSWVLARLDSLPVYSSVQISFSLSLTPLCAKPALVMAMVFSILNYIVHSA